MSALSVISTITALGNLGVSLTLGGFTFQGTEVPQEIGKLGGSQRIAIHEFPGGAKSLQTYGAFPNTISFKGIMTGPNAFSRSVALDRLRITGALIPLLYAQFGYLGVISEYNATPVNQWRVPYQLTFEPQQDISNGVNGFLGGTLGAEATMALQTTGLGNLLGGVPFALPTSLTTPITNLLTTVKSALATASGIVADITSSDSTLIQDAVKLLQTATDPLILNPDSLYSSPALDASSYAAAINALVTIDATPQYQVRAINPNLFLLAAQYLGNASNWTQIAQANGLLDPQPIGEFVLNIP